ncbi:MAG: flagellar basal body-associated FliL family protein [Gemmataceae bacterium]|nr:flagellar basal body-associated FliL family protein [Gemmataceae bacterium]
MADHSSPAPPAKGGKPWIMLIVVAVCSIGAGAASPFLLGATRSGSDEGDHGAGHGSGHGGGHAKGGHGGHGHGGGHGAAPKKAGQETFLPFGEAVVNLAEGRLSRYLRVKVVLVADTKAAKDLEEHLEQRKATLKNWLITHLSDKTLRDVTGRASINRARREILDRFAAELDPDSTGSLRDVLFEEFVVQ